MRMMSSTEAASVDKEYEVKKEALKKTLRREYASLFNPMERQFYTKEVEFIDPLNSFKGVDSYQANVDFLGSRSLPGKILFRDGGIVLHKIEDNGPRGLITRWTLRVTANFLPWQPTGRFTGISVYELDDDAKVLKQTDYWDSLNLENGEYKIAGKLAGVKDFVSQLTPQSQAQQAMNDELPFELLRRAKEYEVRRYPAFEAIETDYQNRPEGYDRLGTYASGWNAEERKVRPFSPSLMKIKRDESLKTMTWPVGFANQELNMAGGASSVPAPAEDAGSIIRKASVPARTVAVVRFENPATAPVVKYYAGRLKELLDVDGLVPTKESTEVYSIAQYDAIFSIGTRRNEVWMELDKGHLWD